MAETFGGGPEMAAGPPMDPGLVWQTQQQQLPSLLQMAQGGGGIGGGDFGGSEPEPNFPTNWQNDPAFFTWGGRGREFQSAVDTFNNGGDTQAAAKYLEGRSRPSMAYMQGADLPSTNDWQKLPRAYRRPGYALQNGRIIDIAMASDPRRYLESLGIGQDDPGHYKMSPGVGIGVPLSLNDLSIGGQKGVWPGDVRGRESFSNPSYPTT